jgi:hypothetical protein
MSTLTETGHAGGFILSVANGNRSFANITVASGENMQAGEVYGLVAGDAVPFDPDDVSYGAGTVAGILFADTDASSADTAAAGVVRDAEVNGNELVWKTGISGGDKATAITALAALGIIVR